MAGPFSLSKGKKDKAGSGDYKTLLKKNMARYKDRDEAVRKTNIASGYGNSTAQKFMGGGGEAKAAPAKSGGGAKAPAGKKSQNKKSNFSLPKEAPVPTARPDPVTTAATPGPSYPYPPVEQPQQSYPYPPADSGPSYPYPPASPPPDPLMGSGRPMGQSPFQDPLMGAGRPMGQPPLPDSMGAGRPPLNLNANMQTPSSVNQPGSLSPGIGPVGGSPVVGSGGPVGAGNPLVGAAPGPNPVSGMGGASGAGNPLIDPRIIARLLGLGG